MIRNLILVISVIFLVSCGKEAVKEEAPPKPVKKQEVKKTEHETTGAQASVEKPSTETAAKKEEANKPSPKPEVPEPAVKTTVKAKKVFALNPSEYTIFPAPQVFSEVPDLPWEESWLSLPEQNLKKAEEEEKAAVLIREAETMKSPSAVLEEAVPLVEAVPESINILYMVRPNDFLALIAKKEYGDVRMWKTIWSWNREIIGENPNQIYPFNEYTLKKPPELANPVQYEFYEYTVLPNESLWKIAKKEYGNPLAWIVILRDNFDSIGSEHDFIPAGTILKLRTKLY